MRSSTDGPSLRDLGFADPDAAKRALDRLARAESPLDDPGRQRILEQLAGTADPDTALLSLERLVENRPGLLSRLLENRRGLESLLTLFAGSQFLTDIVLRQPETLEVLLDFKRLTSSLGHRELRVRLDRQLAEAKEQDLDPASALRRFQRRQLLRIGGSDLLGLIDLPTVAEQLSTLADVVVQAALELVYREDEGIALEDFAVVAYGKLGGGELNYSSDIDLAFCSRADAPEFWPLARRLVGLLSEVTPEGFLYRVDLRLRPWGRDGSLVSSLGTYLEYMERTARPSERQALLKARPIAGNLLLGRELLARTRLLVFGRSADEIRVQVRSLKSEIERQLSARGRDWGEVKSGRGSIRDVEFATQALQLMHGHEYPDATSGNTLRALSQLYAAELLEADEYRILVGGYVFLRTVEHSLQLMHNLQVHALPSDEGELSRLAQRLGFTEADASERFVQRYEQHRATIRRTFLRILDAVEPEQPQAQRSRILERMPLAYGETFSPSQREKHAELLEALDEENLAEIDVRSSDGLFEVTVASYDLLGSLSLICGLLYVQGLDILDGHVFSSSAIDPGTDAGEDVRPRSPGAFRGSRQGGLARRGRLVDVFTVRPVGGSAPDWTELDEHLEELLRVLLEGGHELAQTELSKRIALRLRRSAGPSPGPLPPVDVRFDNDRSELYTRLEIRAPDTVGFLYEFTNALALSGVSVRTMTVASVGDRVHNTLFVSDAHGRKITDPDKLRQLRVATVLTKHFTHLLPSSPNPVSALLHFREFLGDLFRRREWQRELVSLERPEVLAKLALVLGVSDFLWEDFLRLQHENLFPLMTDADELRGRTPEELEEELETLLAGATDNDEARRRLNEFKDREMFRTDLQQIVGDIRFDRFSTDLSNLADVVFRALDRLVSDELVERYGRPVDELGEPVGHCLCALGKWGGRELGYASDLELMLIYGGEGTTPPPTGMAASEFFERWVEELQRSVVSRHEGIFEVDLRLRPFGESGPLAVSAAAFERYFRVGGDAWPYERQALVRLRPIAGDPSFCEHVVELRDRFLYRGEGPDLPSMQAMRERQVRHLVTPGTVNAKFSPGGLVDVEYLIQTLQLRHGDDRPELRATATLEALDALRRSELVPKHDADELEANYRFLRRLINSLRMVRGNARDLTVPPRGSDELRYLSRRMGLESGSDLARALETHLESTRRLQRDLLGPARPSTAGGAGRGQTG